MSLFRGDSNKDMKYLDTQTRSIVKNDLILVKFLCLHDFLPLYRHSQNLEGESPNFFLKAWQLKSSYPQSSA